MAGAYNCPVAIDDSLHYFHTPQYEKTKAENVDLYGKLSTDWFDGLFVKEQM